MKEKKPLIIEIIVGIILIGIGIMTSFDYYSNMIFAMGFGLSFSAVTQLIRMMYWQSSAHQEEYEARKRAAYIDRIDERKQYIRAKAGMISYQIMTIFLLILSFILALIQVRPWIIGMVYLLFILQWVVGVVIFRILEKRM